MNLKQTVRGKLKLSRLWLQWRTCYKALWLPVFTSVATLLIEQMITLMQQVNTDTLGEPVNYLFSVEISSHSANLGCKWRASDKAPWLPVSASVATLLIVQINANDTDQSSKLYKHCDPLFCSKWITRWDTFPNGLDSFFFQPEVTLQAHRQCPPG